MEVKNFLFCFPIKTGVYVIGAMLVLNLAFALVFFHLSIGFFIKLAMVGFFGATLLHDSEQTRMWFFIAFLVNPVLQGIAVLIDQLHLGLKRKIIHAIHIGEYAQDACEKMAPEDFHRLFKSMKQCVRY